MHRAAYSFSHENVKIIPFKTGDTFIVLKENENGWWLCQAKNGRIGLVPSNYIEEFEPNSVEVTDFIKVVRSQEPNQKHYFSIDYLPLAKSVLDRLQENIKDYKKQPLPPPPSLSSSTTNYPLSSSSSSTTHYTPSSSSSSSSPLPPTPHVLPSSPLTPTQPDKSLKQKQQEHIHPKQHLAQHKYFSQSKLEKYTDNNISYFQQNLMELEMEICNTNNTKSLKQSLPFKDKPLPNNLFWSLVTKIRECTDINFENSKEVLKLVLSELLIVQPSWNDVMASLLEQENIDIEEAINVTESEDIINENNDNVVMASGNEDDGILSVQISLQNILLQSKDSQDLTQIFEKIGEVLEDGQQSSWHLFEDLHDNTQLLSRLLHILMNANECLCRSVLSKEEYLSCHQLVQYYQMETRISLRTILIKIFRRICNLGDRFISELLTLILPLELARQLMSGANQTVLNEASTLLCVLFSTNECIPQHHYNSFNQDFVMHILDMIESQTSETSESGLTLRENLIEMLISFNQHLDKSEDNICMEALRNRSSHKNLTEYLLLLFNRGGSPKSTQAVMKFLIDIFSNPSTANIFYTNDANVMLDVIYRQVNDLSAGDQERTKHLYLLHLFLQHSNYPEYPHRQQEIRAVVQQICSEDPPYLPDQNITLKIVEFFSKLDK